MPAIKRTSHAKTYSDVSKDAYSLGDNNFCAPAAVAIATGREYHEVMHAMEAHGRDLRNGTPRHIIMKVLKELGFKAKSVDLGGIISGYPKPHCNVLKNVTTHHARRFPGCFDPEKTYIAFTRGHVLCIKGGEVQDWSVNNSLRIYKLLEVVSE
jgi:hypothetical protein